MRNEWKMYIQIYQKMRNYGSFYKFYSRHKIKFRYLNALLQITSSIYIAIYFFQKERGKIKYKITNKRDNQISTMIRKFTAARGRSIKSCSWHAEIRTESCRRQNIYSLPHFRLEYWKTNLLSPEQRALFAVLLAFQLSKWWNLYYVFCDRSCSAIYLYFNNGIMKDRREWKKRAEKIFKYAKYLLIVLLEIYW